MSARGIPKIHVDNRRNQPVTLGGSWNPITQTIVIKVLDNRSDNQIDNFIALPQKTTEIRLDYSPKKICPRCTQPLQTIGRRKRKDGSLVQRFKCRNNHFVNVTLP